MIGLFTTLLTHSPATKAQAHLRATAVAALAAGQGVCLTGDMGSGKTTMLGMLLSAPELQHRSLRVVLDAEAAPLDVASRIAAAKIEAGAAGSSQQLLVVAEDVDRLRRDTLVLLDELARQGVGNALFLLTGRPSLLHRLVANGHTALVSAVPTLLLLRPLTADQAGAQVGWLAGPGRPPARRASAAMLRLAGGNPARLAAAFASHAQRSGGTAWPLALGAVAGLLLLGSVAGWVLPHHGEPAATGTVPPSVPAPVPRPAATDAVEPSPPAEGAAELPAPSPRGLVLLARAGDTLPELYRRVYLGVIPPPYDEVVAANLLPIRTGRTLVFPTPPLGWHRH